MKFFKKLFSEKMFLIIIGTCVSVLIILFTLGVLETVIVESNGTQRWLTWKSRLEQVDRILTKDEVVLYADTLQGECFGFKNLIVFPVMEMKRDSLGEHQRLLNFQLYDVSRDSISMLFSNHQNIFNSKLVKVKNTVLWFIESDTVAYIYDSRQTQYISFPKDRYCRLVYPSSKNDLLQVVDEVDSEEQDIASLSRTKSPRTLPDVFCDDNTYQSFSLVDGLLIFSAECRHSGKQYWLYDLNAKKIIWGTYEIKNNLSGWNL